MLRTGAGHVFMEALANIRRSCTSLFQEVKRRMPLGYQLWIVALVKLFIMFAVLRAFFFPNFLGERFDTAEEKSSYVGSELVDRGR